MRMVRGCSGDGCKKDVFRAQPASGLRSCRKVTDRRRQKREGIRMRKRIERACGG
jgi:hypothetical protein